MSTQPWNERWQTERWKSMGAQSLCFQWTRCWKEGTLQSGGEQKHSWNSQVIKSHLKTCTERSWGGAGGNKTASNTFQMYFFSKGRGQAKNLTAQAFHCRHEEINNSCMAADPSTLPVSVYSSISLLCGHMIIEHFWTRGGSCEAWVGLDMLRLIQCLFTCNTTLNAAWMLSMD